MSSSDGFSADLEGVEETLEKISKFVIAEKRALEEALEYILKNMVNYAKNNAPFNDRTGNLRNSISANVEEMRDWNSDTDPAVLRSKAAELEEPVIRVSGDDYEAVFSAGMEYSIWVELKSGYWVIQGAIDKIEPLIAQYFAGYLAVEKIDLEFEASIAYAKRVGD